VVAVLNFIVIGALFEGAKPKGEIKPAGVIGFKCGFSCDKPEVKLLLETDDGQLISTN